MENKIKGEKMEVYAFIKNIKTKTIHILKTEREPNGYISQIKIDLVFDHKSFSKNDLDNNLITYPYNNYITWINISDAREAAKFFANQGYNVCGNCVRELYKNNYPDMD